MATLRIGIASYEDMKKRTIDIAKGKYKPGKGEPKVWFTSAESFAKVLSDKNRVLLNIIAGSENASITDLANKTGRKKSNLSRTIKTMAHYGLIKLKKASRGRIIPVVPYTKIDLVLEIGK